MPDISDLIINVRNSNDAVNEIKKVTDALKETGKTATTVGKGLFATWTFTKVIQGAKMLGDAFKDSLISLRNFDVLYGKFNSQADKSVKLLQSTFFETEVSAKRLLNIIGSRTFEFGFDSQTFTKLNSEIAEASENLASFFQIDAKDAADKLTRSLYGMTKGLTQFGVVVDTTSDSFKKEVEQLKLYEGLSEKSASVLVIWSKAREQLKKFQGANKEEAKTLSKSLDNLTNTFKTGIFPKAGEILSTIFVPILNKINDILSEPWVQQISAIVVTLGGVLIAIKSITVAMGVLKTVLTGFSALKGIAGIASTGAFATIGAKLTGGIGAITAAIAGWPVALTAAVIGVLTVAGTMIVNKVTTGSWLDFSKIEEFFTSIADYFKGIGSAIRNKFAHGEFKSDTQLSNDLDARFKSLKTMVKFTDDVIGEGESLFAKLKHDSTFKNLDSGQQQWLDKIKRKYNDAYKAYKDNEKLQEDLRAETEKLYKKWSENKTVENWNLYIQKYKELINTMSLSPNLGRDLQVAKDRLANTISTVGQKVKETADNLFKEFIDSLSKTFNLKDWWERINQDFLRLKYDGRPDQTKILASIKERTKNITDFIDKVEDELKKQLALPTNERDTKKIQSLEQLRLDKQKELVSLIKEETNIKLDGLKREEEIIKETNDMIFDYAKRALEFRETGSEAIKSGTMEELKFITSSLAPVGQLQTAINNSNAQSVQLDQKRNSILTESKNVLLQIKSAIEKNTGIQLNAVSI